MTPCSCRIYLVEDTEKLASLCRVSSHIMPRSQTILTEIKACSITDSWPRLIRLFMNSFELSTPSTFSCLPVQVRPAVSRRIRSRLLGRASICQLGLMSFILLPPWLSALRLSCRTGSRWARPPVPGTRGRRTGTGPAILRCPDPKPAPWRGRLRRGTRRSRFAPGIRVSGPYALRRMPTPGSRDPCPRVCSSP